MVTDLTEKVTVAVGFQLTGVEKLKQEFKKLNEGYMNWDKFTKQTEMFGKSLNNSFQVMSGGRQQTGVEKLKQQFKKLNDGYMDWDKFTKQTEMFGKSLNNSFQVMSGGRQHLRYLRDGMDSFKGVMLASQDSWVQVNDAGLRFNTLGGRIGNSLRRLTAGMRGFRMEMLGVMFFGMGMTRLFGQMLKPAAQAFGVFDLWGQTLQMVFLPTMIDLYPSILNVSTALMNLPEGAKTTIGGITLAGLALGKVMAVGGALALGLGSLITALGETKTLAALTSNSLKSLSTVAKGLSLVAGLALTFKWAKDVDEMMSDVQTTWSDRIKTTFEGALAGALIGFTFGPGGAVVGAAIGFGISIAVNLLDIAWEKGWDQKLYDWVQKAKTAIQNALESIKSWWINLRVNIATGGKGVSTVTNYDPATGIRTLTADNGGAISTKSSGVTINQNLTVTGSMASEVKKIVAEENDKLANKLTRNIG